MNMLVEKQLVLESFILSRDDSVWLISDMTVCYKHYIKEIGDIIFKAHIVNRNELTFKTETDQSNSIQVLLFYHPRLQKICSQRLYG